MNLHVVRCLLARELKAAINVRARLAEAIIFPLSFLVIWGLLFSSGFIDQKIAGELLIINLIWTASAQFQVQANMGFLFDIWARELVEYFREGVAVIDYCMARLCHGIVMGMVNLLVFCISLPIVFGAGKRELYLLFIPFPAYFLSALGFSLMCMAAIVRLGRTYAFIAWTALQVIIMCSSPFSPVARLPWLMRMISYVSPFTPIFEFVRSQQMNFLILAVLEGLCCLLIGVLLVNSAFCSVRRRSGLARV